MNPYQVLGVKPDATDAQIQRAHRKMAMKHHPDRGGSREKFEEVHLAYQILMDKERRAHFDRTGEIPPEQKLSQEDSSALQCLSTVFNSEVSDCLQKSLHPGHVDLVVLMRKNLQVALARIESQRPPLEKGLAFLRGTLGRFVVDGPDNHLEGFAKGQVKLLEKQVAAVEDQVRLTRRMMEILEKYRYKFDTMWSSVSGISMYSSSMLGYDPGRIRDNTDPYGQP